MLVFVFVFVFVLAFVPVTVTLHFKLAVFAFLPGFFTYFTFTLIVAVPSFFAATFPDFVTVATVLLDEENVFFLIFTFAAFFT